MTQTFNLRIKNIDASKEIPESFATFPLDQLPVLLKISCTGTGAAGVDTALRIVCGALGVLRTVGFPSFDIR
jgi:hypothetical protein